MPSFNSLNLVGHVGQDAVLRDAGANKVLAFSVAYSSPYGDKATTWFNVSFFGKRAEGIAPYVLKGTLVAVTGVVTLRGYTSKDGVEKSSLDVNATDIQLLSSPQANGDSNASNSDDDLNEDDVDF
jgi:single-strand DNA-binding protein